MQTRYFVDETHETEQEWSGVPKETPETNSTDGKTDPNQSTDVPHNRTPIATPYLCPTPNHPLHNRNSKLWAQLHFRFPVSNKRK